MSSETPYPVTVVLRSYNDAALLPRTLAALDRQRGVKLTLFVFESASSDGSKEILEQHGYDRIEHLESGSYHSSTVLNQGASWAETEFVAFVNSDAILMSDDVLLLLAQALDRDPRCAGAFARQLPRPGASALTRLDHYTAFEQREQLGPNFDYMSLVTSMIRRSCWQKNPFESSLTYAEDYVWSARAKQQGWSLAYVRDAAVEHSHDYSIKEQYRRSFGDAAAVAILDAQAPPADALRGVCWPFFKRTLRDCQRLRKMGNFRALWQLPAYRWAASLGQWQGARAAWREGPPKNRSRQPLAPR